MTRTKEWIIQQPVALAELTHTEALIRVRAGSIVRLHPDAELFAQGAEYAELTSIRADGTVYVRPLVGGSVLNRRFKIATSDILFPAKD